MSPVVSQRSTIESILRNELTGLADGFITELRINPAFETIVTHSTAGFRNVDFNSTVERSEHAGESFDPCQKAVALIRDLSKASEQCCQGSFKIANTDGSTNLFHWKFRKSHINALTDQQAGELKKFDNPRPRSELVVWSTNNHIPVDTNRWPAILHLVAMSAGCKAVMLPDLKKINIFHRGKWESFPIPGDTKGDIERWYEGAMRRGGEMVRKIASPDKSTFCSLQVAARCDPKSKLRQLTLTAASEEASLSDVSEPTDTGEIFTSSNFQRSSWQALYGLNRQIEKIVRDAHFQPYGLQYSEDPISGCVEISEIHGRKTARRIASLLRKKFGDFEIQISEPDATNNFSIRTTPSVEWFQKQVKNEAD